MCIFVRMFLVGLCLMFGGTHSASAANAGTQAGESAVAALQLVEPLRQWRKAIASSLKENEQTRRVAASGCSLRHDCSATAEFSCQSRVVIHQNVQRFGQFQHMIAQGHAHELQDSLRDFFHAERLELNQKDRQLQQMIRFLDRDPDAQSFSDAEVQDQVARARAAAGSSVGRIHVYLSVPSREGSAKLDANHSCLIESLVKPAAMYSSAAVAEANRLDEHGDPIMSPADISQVLARETSLWGSYSSSFTYTNDNWAKQHKLLTYVWLYVLNLWAFMVPCSASGPEMPEASCHTSCVGFLPSSHMFGPDVSCASPLGIITETANPGASVWFECCEFGLLTFSPRPSARSSCWMIPGIGQVGQIIPGRMLPDRTVFGSHPLGCFNLDGRPDIYSQTYLAPGKQGYDPVLVQLLYELASGNATFAKATFYTTSLTHLAILGWYPQSTALQHHGVQFTLKDGSVGMSGKLMNESKLSADGARVLTVEMMSEGLLWSLRDSELAQEDVHSTETYEFDSIPPEVVADYILDQKGTTYRDANCQAYAKNLMDRILFHGHQLKVLHPVIGNRPAFTSRFVMILSLAVVAIMLSMAAQWLLFWRSLYHLRVKGDKWFPGTSLCKVAEAIAEDMYSLERWTACAFGGRAASLLRRTAVAALMFQSPPVFWYVIAKHGTSEKGLSKTQAAVRESHAPLLAVAEGM